MSIQRWRDVGVMVADSEHGWWVRLDDHERVVAEVREDERAACIAAIEALPYPRTFGEFKQDAIAVLRGRGEQA